MKPAKPAAVKCWFFDCGRTLRSSEDTICRKCSKRYPQVPNVAEMKGAQGEFFVLLFDCLLCMALGRLNACVYAVLDAVCHMVTSWASARLNNKKECALGEEKADSELSACFSALYKAAGVSNPRARMERAMIAPVQLRAPGAPDPIGPFFEGYAADRDEEEEEEHAKQDDEEEQEQTKDEAKQSEPSDSGKRKAEEFLRHQPAKKKKRAGY